MVAPTQRGVFITRYEAIRNFVTMTILYVAIIFRREIFAWQEGVTVDELYKHGPPGTLVIVIGSFFYFGFLIFWCLSVFDSYKHYRRKQRDLKVLLEEQQRYRESLYLNGDADHTK